MKPEKRSVEKRTTKPRHHWEEAEKGKGLIPPLTASTTENNAQLRHFLILHIYRAAEQKRFPSLRRQTSQVSTCVFLFYVLYSLDFSGRTSLIHIVLTVIKVERRVSWTNRLHALTRGTRRPDNQEDSYRKTWRAQCVCVCVCVCVCKAREKPHV